MESNQHYPNNFLADGKLTKEDLLNYYQGEDVKDRFRYLEKEINNLGKN